MRWLSLCLGLLWGCRPPLDFSQLEAAPVFAPFYQPWSADPRGTAPAMRCDTPFGFAADAGDRVAEAVFLAAIAAGQKADTIASQVDGGGFFRVDSPSFTARALDALRLGEQNVWKLLAGAPGERHTPRTPSLSSGSRAYAPGVTCLLPAAEGYAFGMRIGAGDGACQSLLGTDYRWSSKGGRIRVENADLLSVYDPGDGILVLRGDALLLLAKSCVGGFGCVSIDWVELGEQPFVEHMKFDESGGSSERRYFVAGASRLQQRAYRRDENGLACLRDMLEREDGGGLLRPWSDPSNATDAPWAADVFAHDFAIGAAVGLDAPTLSDDKVLRWTASSGALSHDTTAAMGFSAKVNGDAKSFGLMRSRTDPATLTVDAPAASKLRLQN